jgi:hypothetical protein
MIPIPPLEAPSKTSAPRQDIMEKEETINGDYDIDVTCYFKLFLQDVHKTIFQEE